MHCVKCCVVLMYTLETLNVSVLSPFSVHVCVAFTLGSGNLLLQCTQRPKTPANVKGFPHILVTPDYDVTAGVVLLTGDGEAPALMSGSGGT